MTEAPPQPNEVKDGAGKSIRGSISEAERAALASKILRARPTRGEPSKRQKALIEVSVRCEDEIFVHYLEDLRKCDACNLRYLIGEGPLEVFWADFYKGPTQDGSIETVIKDENRFASRCFMWDGNEKDVVSARGYAPILREFINKVRKSRTTYWWTFMTSPLTIGGVIGLCLVILVATLELRDQYVPDQLWSLLTAVIAFYFGRGSVEARKRDQQE